MNKNYSAIRSYLSISHGLSQQSANSQYNEHFVVPHNVIVFMNGTTEPILANDFIMTCLWYLAITTKDIVVNSSDKLHKGLHTIIQRFNKYLHYNPIYQSDMTQYKPKFCIYGPEKMCPNLFLEYDVKHHVYGLYPLPVSIFNNGQKISRENLADYLDKQYNNNQKMIDFYKSKAELDKYTAGANYYRDKTTKLTEEQLKKFKEFTVREKKALETTNKLYLSIVEPLVEEIESDAVINKVRPFVVFEEDTPKNLQITVEQKDRSLISNTRVQCTASSCSELDSINYLRNVVSAISESDKEALHVVVFFACRSGLAIQNEHDNQICIDENSNLKSIVAELLTKQKGGKKTKATRKK
jgi:hypothetical protein